MKSVTEQLRNADYYKAARSGSMDMNHPAMVTLRRLVLESQRVIDLGCGEGTRLSMLLNGLEGKEGIGVDVSKKAIQLAKKQYPKIRFLEEDLSRLSFKDNSFDLAYSAFVFEHLKEPEKVLSEAKRILKKDGKVLIVAPNFGAPNRRSPNSKEGKLEKLVRGWIRDIRGIREGKLEWNKVQSKSGCYEMDSDTVIEPYLRSLIEYCRHLGFKIKFVSSCWEKDHFSFFQLNFRLLGTLGIYPFRYWGPHIFLIVEK